MHGVNNERHIKVQCHVYQGNLGGMTLWFDQADRTGKVRMHDLGWCT